MSPRDLHCARRPSADTGKSVKFRHRLETDGLLASSGPAFRVAGGRVSNTERRLAHHLLRMIGSPPLRLTLWNGEEVAECNAAPAAPDCVPRSLGVLESVARPELPVWRGLQRRAG